MKLRWAEQRDEEKSDTAWVSRWFLNDCAQAMRNSFTARESAEAAERHYEDLLATGQKPRAELEMTTKRPFQLWGRRASGALVADGDDRAEGDPVWLLNNLVEMMENERNFKEYFFASAAEQTEAERRNREDERRMPQPRSQPARNAKAAAAARKRDRDDEPEEGELSGDDDDWVAPEDEDSMRFAQNMGPAVRSFASRYEPTSHGTTELLGVTVYNTKEAPSRRFIRSEGEYAPRRPGIKHRRLNFGQKPGF